jgi:hypothetical protein
MGKTMAQRGGLMSSGPPKIAETMVALLIPPACREEIVGDLHQRFESPLQYAADAFHTVPLVVLSRMRRTADPQILLIQAFALYMSFLGAAWLADPSLLQRRWGLFRLAIPAAITLLGLLLDDIYANPATRSALHFARGPLLGILLAFASQEMLWLGKPDLTVPRSIVFYGCAMSLLLSSALRMLFPPVTSRLLGAHIPAFWLKRAGSRAAPQGILRALKYLSPAMALAALWLVLFVAYELSKPS